MSSWSWVYVKIVWKIYIQDFFTQNALCKTSDIIRPNLTSIWFFYFHPRKWKEDNQLTIYVAMVTLAIPCAIPSTRCVIGGGSPAAPIISRGMLSGLIHYEPAHSIWNKTCTFCLDTTSQNIQKWFKNILENCYWNLQRLLPCCFMYTAVS